LGKIDCHATLAIYLADPEFNRSAAIRRARDWQAVWVNIQSALTAWRLLAHTTQTIQSIALELDFEDAANFNQFFKRLEAGTPGAFRLKQIDPSHSLGDASQQG
jgi:AraC-like DNA-binding protein